MAKKLSPFQTDTCNNIVKMM